MSVEDRRQSAIQSVQSKIDQARDDRQIRGDEAADQSQRDAAELAKIDMYGPPVDSQEGSAGRQRALESVRQWHQDRQDRWDLEAEEKSDDLSALCGSTQPRRRQSSPSSEIGFGDDDGDFDG